MQMNALYKSVENIQSDREWYKTYNDLTWLQNTTYSF
jgi:hypothetical protein